MKSQNDIYYEAVQTRDTRFDGKFFIGVKTTGIYCRPICPAKPKRENMEFFHDAHSAEKAGYRPCLRCRPECAPHSPAWMGRSAVVNRALRLIENNALLTLNEDEFAEQLGITARHLRRLFNEEVGKTPKQISDANRLGFARKLVVETRLPIIEIALVAGFSSLRRFNDAFRLRFHRAPSELRRATGAEPGENKLIQLRLPFRPPLDWTSLLQFYRTHTITGVENIVDGRYDRVFRSGDSIGAFSVQESDNPAELLLKVCATNPKCLYKVVQTVRQMFDLDLDPVLISNALASSEILSTLADRYPGLRLARGFDSFETSICTILGQLVSVEQAKRLVGQLVELYGEQIKHPHTGEKRFLFPTPGTLAKSDLDGIGTTRARKVAIREFSRAVVTGKLVLHPAQDLDALQEKLIKLPGIGPWTAEYIRMRALGDSDAFPASDLILRRAIQLHPRLDLHKVKPWRAYAAVYLWKEFALTLTRLKKAKRPLK